MKYIQLMIMMQALLLWAPANAKDHQRAVDLAVLEGHWIGQLVYRDYGSNREVSLPMEVNIKLSGDAQFLISDVIYTDPGYKVYAHVVTRFDQKNEKVHEYYFSNGTMTESSYDMDSIQHTDSTWTIEYSTAGQDAGKDANIRIRKTISATEYISQQWVQYAEGEAFIRNQTRLKKTQ